MRKRLHVDDDDISIYHYCWHDEWAARAAILPVEIIDTSIASSRDLSLLVLL